MTQMRQPAPGASASAMQPYPIAIHHNVSSSNQEVNDPEVINLVNDTGHLNSICLQGRVSDFVFLWNISWLW